MFDLSWYDGAVPFGLDALGSRPGNFREIRFVRIWVGTKIFLCLRFLRGVCVQTNKCTSGILPNAIFVNFWLVRQFGFEILLSSVFLHSVSACFEFLHSVSVCFGYADCVQTHKLHKWRSTQCYYCTAQHATKKGRSTL